MMILGHPVVDVVLGFPVLLLLLFVFTAVPETAVVAAVSAASGSGIVARAGSFIRIKPGDNIFKIWNILVCRSIIFETIVVINYLFLVLAKIQRCSHKIHICYQVYLSINNLDFKHLFFSFSILWQNEKRMQILC